jgi:hypothetical protein
MFTGGRVPEEARILPRRRRALAPSSRSLNVALRQSLELPAEVLAQLVDLLGGDLVHRLVVGLGLGLGSRFRFRLAPQPREQGRHGGAADHELAGGHPAVIVARGVDGSGAYRTAAASLSTCPGSDDVGHMISSSQPTASKALTRSFTSSSPLAVPAMSMSAYSPANA